MTDESDRYYIQRCLDGHRDDFRHLVRRHERPLLAGIRFRRVPDEEAREVAQEAFVRAFTRLGTLRKPESFYAWLVGIAYRVLWENAERVRRERAGRARLTAESEVARSTVPWSGDAALEAALARLDEPLREVILLRFYGGCSCDEVAGRLGIPLGTVTKRLSRAYVELRRGLEAAEA